MQSFDRCEAAPQFTVNSALDGYIEVHMGGLHGTGPTLALDLVRTDLSRTIRFKVRSGHEVRTPQTRESVAQRQDRDCAQPELPEGRVAQHGIDELQTGTDTEHSWTRQAEA